MSAAECLQHPLFRQCQGEPESELQQTLSLLTRSRERPHSLKEAVKRLIVRRMLTAQEAADATSRFELLDDNSDGVVSLPELLEKLSVLMPESEARVQSESIIAKVDRNRNRVIDYTEFLLSAVTDDVLYANGRLESTFRLFDQNNDGLISLQELQSFFSINISVASGTVWERIVAEADTSGDGYIDFGEFERMMRDDTAWLDGKWRVRQHSG